MQIHLNRTRHSPPWTEERQTVARELRREGEKRAGRREVHRFAFYPCAGQYFCLGDDTATLWNKLSRFAVLSRWRWNLLTIFRLLVWETFEQLEIVRWQSAFRTSDTALLRVSTSSWMNGVEIIPIVHRLLYPSVFRCNLWTVSSIRYS